MLPTRNAHMALAARRRSSGFSLMELAMVLAIIALLIAGVMLFFSNASTSQKTNDALSELANIQQVTRSLYAGQSSYTGLTTAQIAASQQVPAKWVNGTSLATPFASAASVAPATNNVAGDSFIITYNGIPSISCNKMLTMDFGTSLIKVTANSTSVSARAMTPTEANGACTGSNNTLAWTLN